MRIFYFAFITILFINFSFKAISQCTNCTINYPSATQSTTSSTFSNISTCMYASDYVICDVVSGNTYEWTTCGDSDFDTELTLYVGNKCTNTPAGSQLAYNDDDCGVQSTITWTATFTGTVRLLVSEYDSFWGNCQSNSTCMTVQWRCTDCSGGGGSTINTCTGNFYDTGGAGGNYSTNEDYTVTYCPDVVGSMIKFNFSAFNVETNNDYLEIYNGDNTSAPLYQAYDNLNPISGLVSANNATGCLTFVFHSNNTVQNGGWAAAISCGVPCQLVLSGANATPAITSGYIDVCQGTTVSFNGYGTYPQNGSNYTQSDATSTFYWEFGDGTSGTGANTTHTFNDEGIYDVDLFITDINGCRSSNDVNFRVRVSTTPIFTGTTASPSPVCVGNNVTLTGVVTPVQGIFIGQTVLAGMTTLPDGVGICYESSINYDIFAPAQTITSASQIQSFCANLEHSFVGDLNINIICPNGSSMSLKDFINSGGANFGVPITGDATPSPGTGYDYCWNATATTTVNDISGGVTIPAGSYEPDDPFSNLIGCPLNGDWTFEVCDNWAQDNGFIFSWGINFDPSVFATIDQFTPTIVSSVWTGSGVNGAGTNPATATPTSSGTINYTYTVTDNFGCSYSTIVPVSVIGPTLTFTQNNVTCYNGTNGSATVTVVGGTPNYTYTWSGGTPLTTTTATANNTVTGLADGVYSVSVNSGGCQSIGSVTITEPLQMTITLTPTPESCSGADDGEIEVTVTNGTPNFNYSGSGGLTSANNKPASTWTFTGVSNGTYNITVTDANGCIATGSTTVNAGVVVNSAFSYPGNQCYNGANSFTFDNTSSISATSFLWTFAGGTPSTSTDFEPTVIFNSATAGAHNVTLTASIGAACSDLETIILTIYDLPVVSLNPTDVSCNGFCDGSINATVTGGSGVYPTYTWSPAQPNSPNISGLCDGVYALVVKDSYNCSSNSVSTTVNEPAALNVSVSRTDVTCNGLCDGTAQSLVTGGSGSFNYLWCNSDNTQNITGLCAGTCTVTVTDALSSPSCYQTANVSITEPTAMVLTTSSINSSCGLATGTATVTVTDVITGYNYNWAWSSGSNNTTTALTIHSVNSLPSGPVSVTVTNSNGCSESTIINISDNAGATSSITSSTNVSCNGASTGSATVTVVGGTSPYDYVWSSGAVTNNSALLTNTASGLLAGTHTVVITDNVGCVTSSSVTITEPSALIASTTQVSSNCGQSDGSATVNVGGGVSTYTYLWTGGATANNITNKPAGTYCVTVTDANTCTITKCVTISDVGGITSLSTTQTDVSCYGGSDGGACVTANGGTSPYTYIWSNGQTTQCATGLSVAGSPYLVTVTDNVGCTLTTTVTMIQPTQVTGAISSITHVSCFGGSDGSATVAGSGGTSPYTYLWSAGTGFQTTATASNLSTGIYCVTVFDDNICSSSQVCVTINQPTVLNANITSTTQAHCGSADGGATVVASGGTSPYSYVWPTGTPINAATVTGLPSGTHVVTVNDAKGCSITASAVITDLPAGTATISYQENVSCNGLCDGKLTVSVSSATPPYTYLWSSGQANSAITGLCAGNYSVTVTDTYGCTMTTSATITEPAPLTVNVSKEDAGCFGYCNGEATITPSGGTPPYSYIWSNNYTTSSLNILCLGKYYFTVTDIEGCTKIDSVEISEPPQMNITAVITNANCNQKDGAIDITVTDGPSPFTYLWSNGEITEDIDSLQAGSYCVTVTNSKSCKIDSCFIVGNELGPVATISSFTNLTCNNSCDGLATVSVTGGTPAYTYLWSDGQTLATATNLCAATYTVIVTDSAGCVATASVIITEPDLLEYNLTTTNPTCADSCNGIATVQPFGGTAPYTYLWNTVPPQTTATAIGLCAQNYDIIITDDNGCDTLFTIALSQPSNIVLIPTTTDVLCFGNSNGTATVTASGGTPGSPYAYTYEWDDMQTTQTASGLGVGNHCVTVYDDNGCSNSICVTITSPEVLEIVIDTVIDVKCYGNNDGAIVTHAIGGTAPYTYYWSIGGASTSSISSLLFGTYTLVVKDTNMCSAQTNIIVSQPPQLNVTLIIDSVLCKNECNGSIFADVSGGTPITSTNPYTYIWNNSGLDTTSTIINLCAGNYSVTVTDKNSCIKIKSGNVYEPPLLQLIIEDIVPATCDSANGSATVNMLGGTTGYTIEWDGGWNSFTQDNLVAGLYCVSVFDMNQCTTDTCLVINNLDGPVIDSISILNNNICYGDSIAILYVYSSGGTGNIQYLWNNSDTVPLIDSLPVGTYSVTATDVIGCKAVDFIQLIGPQFPVNSAINANNPVTCYGFSDGSASVIAVGGSVDPLNPVYTYQWSTFPQQNTAIASDLSYGVYSVYSYDTLGCFSISNVTITQPDPISISLLEKDDITCFGFQDGKITISATGGTYVFNYNWQTNPVQNGPTASNLSEGTYTIVVSEILNSSCYATYIDSIAEPEPIVATLDYDSPKCSPYYSNGSIFVSDVTGGVSPYSYNWGANIPNNDTLYNISSGNYGVIITDDNNCPKFYSMNVDYIHPPIISYSVTDVTCSQNTDGTALIIVKEGTPPFDYQWSPNNGVGVPNSNTDTLNISNLQGAIYPPMSYSLIVTDSIGCDTTTTFQISSPNPLIITGNGPSTNVCNGANLTISASVNGGTLPLTYTWNQGLPSSPSHVVNPTGLTYYNVTITDANGCSDSVSIPVYVYNLITVTLEERDRDTIICKGDSIVLVETYTEGAGPVYTNTWSHLGINANDTITVFPEGPTNTYTVTIKDKCASTASASVNIVVNPLPNALIASDITDGCEPLTVNFSNEQHDSLYSYSWNFGDDASGGLNFSNSSEPRHIFNNSSSYDISVVVTSQDKCRDTVLVEEMITVFPNPNAIFDAFPDTTGAFRPSVKFYDQSNLANIETWSWNFGDNYSLENTSTLQHPDHYFSGPGLYTVWLTVVSDNDCIDSASNKVRILEEHTFWTPTAFTPSAGGENTEWYPVGIGIDPKNYHLYIYDRWGEIIFQTNVFYDDLAKTGVEGKWNGRVHNKGKIVETGVYAWVVKLKDVLGTDHEYAGTITVIK